MIPRLSALSLALSMLIGCTSYQSQYVRQSSVPGELVWRYDDRLQVTRNGQLVAEADRWDGLAAAVACVPRAREKASAATSRHRWGTALLWAGAISMVAGVAVFEEERARTDHVGTPAVLGSLGTLLVGSIVTLIGGYGRATSSVRGIDAVNIYNDHVTSGGTCAP